MVKRWVPLCLLLLPFATAFQLATRLRVWNTRQQQRFTTTCFKSNPKNDYRRTEAFEDYLSKLSDENLKVLARLENEKKQEVRALRIKMDKLSKKLKQQQPGKVSPSPSLAGNNMLSRLKAQEFEIEQLRTKLQQLKQQLTKKLQAQLERKLQNLLRDLQQQLANKLQEQQKMTGSNPRVPSPPTTPPPPEIQPNPFTLLKKVDNEMKNGFAMVPSLSSKALGSSPNPTPFRQEEEEQK